MPALSNPKHEAFAQNLAKGMNTTEAHNRAGFAKSSANASRLLANDSIQQRLAEILQRSAVIERRAEEKAVERAAEKLSITRERVLEEQARIAFLDPGDVLRWEGNRVVLRNSVELSPAVRAAVSAVRQTKDGVAITFHSKAAALDALGKTLGIGSDKGQASANVGADGELSVLSDLELARRLAFLLAKGAAQAKGD